MFTLSRDHVSILKKNILAVVVVVASVVMNVASGIVLKEMATRPQLSLTQQGLLTLVVVVLMFMAFKLWGFAHKHYPISFTYPLSCIFFPIILLVSFFYGDPISLSKIIGTILVTIGVLWLSLKVS